jgi:hypothetical protein
MKSVGLACVLASVAFAASADDRDQAKRIHDRIAGVPPTEAVLDQMTAMVAASNPLGAALIATQNPSFYNVTLKNLAVPWTNRDQTVFAPLNDYVATFIGMVRDDVPFNTALSADLTYTVNGATPAASSGSNAHYENAETNNINLLTALTPTTQSSIQGIPPAATAGFITSRAASEAFFIDGTNRAMFRFTMMNHMCRDIEPQSRWRQPHLPEQLHRLPQRHGPVLAGVRVLRFRQRQRGSPGHDAPGLRLDRRAFEVLQQRHEFRPRLHHSR